jgi:hypothetical protein
MLHPNQIADVLVAGHGSVLFAIISIETSIGIVCGCLPGCKPLFAKLLPSVFAHSNGPSSYARSQNRKTQQTLGKTADGKSFPFQIVKEGFDVRYESHNGAFDRRASSTKTNTRVVGGSNTDDEDNDVGSNHSGEWIMMQEKPGTKVVQV